MSKPTLSNSLRSLLDIATANMTAEPQVTYDQDGNIIKDEFCRFSDDMQGIWDQDHNFCKADQFEELSGEYLDPFVLVSRIEQEIGAPLALCHNSTKY